MSISASERLVQQIFEARYGVILQKIDEKNGIDGQTADFECVENGKRQFVCELKEVKHIEPSQKEGWEITHHSDGSIEASRTSNALSRISKDIYKGHGQLARYLEPKVLIFLNHSYRLNVSDLEETYRGYYIYEANGITYKNVIAKGASEGKIKELKSKIDLYIWIDAVDSRIDLDDHRITFLFVSKIGQKLAIDHFRIGII